MQKSNKLYTIICGSLPKDIVPIDIESVSISESMYADPQEACINALRQYTNLDWEAYREEYSDVAQAEIDPIVHFVKHGVFEGRKLFCKQKYVSIIITHFNDIYIEYCLKSLINQTMREIEIIIVDHYAAVASSAIVEKFIAKDERIKLLKLDKNQNRYIAHKVGVVNASGKYIMFLDSEDFLTPNACEIAVKAINEGHDIVAFNAKIVSPRYADPSKEHDLLQWLNLGKKKYYNNSEIMSAIYSDYTLSPALCTKIYDSSLVKKAFSMMEEGNFLGRQDEYESFVLCSLARSLMKIKDELYYYRTQIGDLSQASNRHNAVQLFAPSESARLINDYANKHGFLKYSSTYSDIFIKKSIDSWFSYVDNTFCSKFLHTMITEYGIIKFLNCISRHYGQHWELIAEKLMQEEFNIYNKERYEQIGIILKPDMEKYESVLMLKLIDSLKSLKYRVILLIPESKEYIDLFSSSCQVVELKYYKDEDTKNDNYFLELHDALESNKIDMVFLFDGVYSPLLLWKIIMFRSMQVPVFMISPTINVFYDKYSAYNYLHGKIAVMRCVNQVLCFSSDEEIFYRCQHIDAQHIDWPIRIVNKINKDFNNRKNNLAVIVNKNFKNKEIQSCLLILHELVTEISCITMTFIGEFTDVKTKDFFLLQVEQLDLQDNIIITGAVSNPFMYLEQAAIIFSTCYYGNMDESVLAARAYGLPLVVYVSTFVLSHDNTGIIPVLSPDHIGAVQTILEILKDENKWQNICKMIRDKSSLLTEENYMKQIEERIDNFDKFSNLSCQQVIDYKNILNVVQDMFLTSQEQ